MKRVLFATIAALTLSGCNLPDLDMAAYTARNSPQAAVPTQRPTSPYEAGQPPENTGDYSNYF